MLRLAGFFLLADIDECADLEACGEARCKNLPGSYSCLCDEGFAYSSQEKACRGTHATRSPSLSLTPKSRHGCQSLPEPVANNRVLLVKESLFLPVSISLVMACSTTMPAHM